MSNQPFPDTDRVLKRIGMTRGDLDALTGVDLDEAQRRARSDGLVVRVVERDGEGLVITMEFVERRVNVAVRGDQVVRIVGLG